MRIPTLDLAEFNVEHEHVSRRLDEMKTEISTLISDQSQKRLVNYIDFVLISIWLVVSVTTVIMGYGNLFAAAGALGLILLSLSVARHVKVNTVKSDQFQAKLSDIRQLRLNLVKWNREYGDNVVRLHIRYLDLAFKAITNSDQVYVKQAIELHDLLKMGLIDDAIDKKRTLLNATELLMANYTRAIEIFSRNNTAIQHCNTTTSNWSFYHFNNAMGVWDLG